MEKIKTSTLHLICGVPGAGKTTLAKQIEKNTTAVRFAPDEWIKEIWRERAESEGNQLRDQVEELQWKFAKDLLAKNTDVIIEWGTWGRSERERLRDEAKALGAKVSFYLLTGSYEQLCQRILARNKIRDFNEFKIPDDDVGPLVAEALRLFQTPTEDEFKTYDEVFKSSSDDRLTST